MQSSHKVRSVRSEEGIWSESLLAWTISDSDLGTKLCVCRSTILFISTVLLKGVKKFLNFEFAGSVGLKLNCTPEEWLE